MNHPGCPYLCLFLLFSADLMLAESLPACKWVLPCACPGPAVIVPLNKGLQTALTPPAVPLALRDSILTSHRNRPRKIGAQGLFLEPALDPLALH